MLGENESASRENRHWNTDRWPMRPWVRNPLLPRRTTHSGFAIFSGVQLRRAHRLEKACIPTTLRYRHALAIEVNLANPFDPGQHVVGGLTAHTHQFDADNSGHEIARQIQNLLRRCAFKSLAKNRRHCPGM